MSSGTGAVGANGSFRSNSLVQGYEDGRLLLRGDNGVTIEGATKFNAAANFGNNKITGLADGTAATDAVNVRQLNAAVAGATGSKYVQVGAGQASTAANNAGRAGNIAIGGNARSNVGSSNSASIALGEDSLSNNAGSVAVGTTSSATGSGAVALGLRAKATAGNSVALGADSIADRAKSVSVGSATLQRQITNVAAGTAGTDAVNLAQMDTALSNKADISALNTKADISVLKTKVDNTYFKIGSYSGNATLPDARPATASNYGIAIGPSAAATDWHGTAIGTLATAGYFGTALGDSATASGRYASAIGSNASALATNSTALGNGATASAEGAVALGNGSTATIANTVSVGTTAVNGQRGIVNMAAGTLSATSTDAVNGSQLFATNERVSALEAGGIGEDLVSFDPVRGSVDVAHEKGGELVDIAGTDGPRRLTGLANGLADDEAVTIAQLKAAGVLDPTSGTILAALTYDDLSLGKATLGGSRGTVIDNMANGQIAAGSMQAINGGQLFQALTNQASLLGGGASVGLQGVFIAPTYSIQGNNYHDVGAALGALDDKVTELDHRIAGTAASGSGKGMSLMGVEEARMPADVSPADQTPAVASASASAPPAPAAVATVGTAVGAGAVASGISATAIGEGAIASADNSVALGAGSVADRPNTVSVGSAGSERQITNVGEGTEATDAVNKAQLDRSVASANSYTDSQMKGLSDSFEGLKGQVDQRMRNMDHRIDRQGAMSAAMLNMATSAAGVHTDNRVGVGVGFQGGASALSMGYQRAISERATVTLGGAFSGDDASVGFGAGFGW
nr:YadA-like family protein [Stenotrophomonas tumulicola]